MQRSSVFSGANLLVGLRRLGKRQLFGERDDAVQLRPVLFEPSEIHLREVRGRHVLTLDEWRKRCDWQEGEIVERGPRRGRSRRNLERDVDLCAGRCPRLWLVARKVRAERDRRLRIERNIDRAKLLVGVEVAVHACECLFLFGIGEIDAEEFLAALEDVLADSLFLSGRLRQRRQRQTAGDRSGHSS